MTKILKVFITHQGNLEATVDKINTSFNENSVVVVGGYEENKLEGNIIKLTCDDSYCGLPDKVVSMFKFISENSAFDSYTHFHKLDEDMELIKEIGLENLTNITEGGDGFTSEFAKNLWNNEETRNKMLKGIREANSRPEFRQARSKYQKNRMKDASLRKTISEKMQGNTNGVDIWKNEERKKLMAERRKEQWKDEEYRNKNLSGRKKYKETGGKGPNAGKKFDKITRKYYIPTELA
jgi:hypothetical protein